VLTWTAGHCRTYNTTPPFTLSFVAMLDGPSDEARPGRQLTSLVQYCQRGACRLRDEFDAAFLTWRVLHFARNYYACRRQPSSRTSTSSPALGQKCRTGSLGLYCKAVLRTHWRGWSKRRLIWKNRTKTCGKTCVSECTQPWLSNSLKKSAKNHSRGGTSSIDCEKQKPNAWKKPETPSESSD